MFKLRRGRGRKSEWANIFVFIPLWETWSHLKVFTAGINLRDVSSPSAHVESRSGPVAKETSAGHWPACYFRATDNTPPPARPLASRANRLASRRDCKVIHTSHRYGTKTQQMSCINRPGNKERSADTSDGTSVLNLRINSTGLPFYDIIFFLNFLPVWNLSVMFDSK